MSIAARLRRLEARQPEPGPPDPLTDEERVQRLSALFARVIDPDTGEPNTASPEYPVYRRIEELLARARARKAREEQGG